MINAEFLKEIERLVDTGRVHMIGDQHFSTKELYPVFFEPEIQTLEVNSLTGIFDFCKANIDQFDLKKCYIHVESCSAVSLITEISGKEKTRQLIIRAVFQNLRAFEFGRWMDHEKFVIALGSLFENSIDRETLLAFIGKLDITHSIRIDDDGITQQATVKKSLSGATVEEKLAPSTVELKPYRTFPYEIDQPISEFLFRMRGDSDGIECALFVADGGVWKYEAQQRIKAYFKDALPGIPIIA